MKEILDFLTQLSCNNNREWFNEHKESYRKCQHTFEHFTTQWLKRLVEIDPELAGLQPKDCIWRIYRDVRFSHDKRPFKEWFGVFPAVKGGKKSDRGGYYLHIQPQSFGLSLFPLGYSFLILSSINARLFLKPVISFSQKLSFLFFISSV